MILFCSAFVKAIPRDYQMNNYINWARRILQKICWFCLCMETLGRSYQLIMHSKISFAFNILIAALNIVWVRVKLDERKALVMGYKPKMWSEVELKRKLLSSKPTTTKKAIEEHHAKTSEICICFPSQNINLVNFFFVDTRWARLLRVMRLMFSPLMSCM